jgi:hypothetical protein
MVDTKATATQQWPTPTSVKQLRSFLGLAGFYRQFIHMFSEITAPLTALLRKDKPQPHGKPSSTHDQPYGQPSQPDGQPYVKPCHSKSFNWTVQHQQAFDTLKKHISSNPTLILPRDHLPFIVQTDSSGFAVGACLMQDLGKGPQPIAYLSHKMNPAEMNYPTHQQELLGIIVALKSWRHFLYGKRFSVITDHHSFTHFMTQQQLSHRQARWSETLQQFNFEIIYKPGPTNVVADALSRRPDHEFQHEIPKRIRTILNHMASHPVNRMSNHMSSHLSIHPPNH